MKLNYSQESNHKKTVIEGNIKEVCEGLVRIIKKRFGTNAQVMHEVQKYETELQVCEVTDPMLQRINTKVKFNGHLEL